MTQLHPAAKAYLRSVHRQLDAPKADRERLLGRLSYAVSAYCEENPEAAAGDVAAAFGSPADCAAELMAECDPDEVSKMRRNRQRRLWAAVAVLVGLLLALSLLWYDLAVHQVKYVDTYITEDTLNTGGLSP